VTAATASSHPRDRAMRPRRCSTEKRQDFLGAGKRRLVGSHPFCSFTKAFFVVSKSLCVVRTHTKHKTQSYARSACSTSNVDEYEQEEGARSHALPIPPHA
jgi:hypothetical protein